MIEAVYREIPVIRLGFGIFRLSNQRYHFDYNLKIENPKNLAKTIEFIIHNSWIPNIHSKAIQERT